MREHKGLGDNARIVLRFTGRSALLAPITGYIHDAQHGPCATYRPDAVSYDEATGMLTLSFSLPEPGQRTSDMMRRFEDEQETVRLSFNTNHIVNVEEIY